VLGMILAAGESMPAARGGGHDLRAQVELDAPEWEQAAQTTEPVAGVGPDRRVGAEADAMPEVPVEAALDATLAEEVEAEEPPEEFAEALREAVVVPFPRRFAGASAAWENAPGDAVNFNSALWDEPAEGKTEELPEPGGSIPGLPLWEPEDAGTQKPTANPAVERFERIASPAAADAQVLHATVLIEVNEAARLAVVCEREWRDSPPSVVEDVMFRAIAFALRESSGADGIGAMLIAEADFDVSSALAAPAAVEFREAVARRHSGGDAAFESASWLLVSVARQGVYSCTPRLDHGRKLAFAMGSADASGVATLTVAFDSLAWSEGSAARLLARIRKLFESPYAMLI